MKVTKHKHACVVLENEGVRIIIDPGIFTEDLSDVTNVVAVVITHVHSDHFDPQHIAAIIAANPGVQIYSTAEVASQMTAQQVTVVNHGDVVALNAFTLDFFGGEHAIIHESIPKNQNVGVFVNGDFYYPGDAFVTPGDAEISLLALPVSAPWLKVSEVMDYLATMKPAACFPTHNAILSAEGQEIVDRLLSQTCQELGIAYLPLQPGQSVDI